MIRNRDEQRGRGPAMRDRDMGEKEFPERKRRKVCRFCENKINYIDHKDERLLRRFVTERGKIVPRRISGNCAIHQRKLTLAIKRCRHLAILAFSVESYR